MAGSKRRPTSGMPPRAQSGDPHQFVLRRRRAGPPLGRIALLSGILAGGFIALSSTTVALQDVASQYGKDLPVSQRWLARLMPRPSGEAYQPGNLSPSSARLVAGNAVSDGVLIEPVLDVAARGPISAPEFTPPAVNRQGKHNITVAQRKSEPVKTAAARFKAGVLQTADLGSLFSSANAVPKMAFLTAQDVAAPNQPLQYASKADTSKASADGKKGEEVARPIVALASIAPLPRRNELLARNKDAANAKDAAKAPGDLVVSAYANPDQDKALSAPFTALLNRPMAIGKDGKPDHWWVMNKIPASARSASEQKCLATAIYFEARGESVKGELAVAQVVINRLKNPAYPNTICGVVYQNKDMRNACQFSFACDGIPDRITDATSWARAQMLAKRVLFEENWWNADVGSSTHYHANYVKPRWARTMKKMQKVGHHIFYKTYGGGWI